MKVAVAISHPALERDVISALRAQGKDVIRRCLDDSDIAAVPKDIPIYADSRFHVRHPATILVTSTSDLASAPAIRTHTIGVVGPHGAPGVSTVALNLAVSLKAAFIDAAPFPSVASMTGIRTGNWHGVEIFSPPLISMQMQLAGIGNSNTVIDLGAGVVDRNCDEVIVVVSAHPLSVERYLSRDFGPHRLVLNRMEPGAIGQTAHRMIDRSASEVIVIPRDDRSCNDSFISAKPLLQIAPKSAMVRAINSLAGIKAQPRKGRVIAVG